jgi:hypothetical protein
MGKMATDIEGAVGVGGSRFASGHAAAASQLGGAGVDSEDPVPASDWKVWCPEFLEFLLVQKDGASVTKLCSQVGESSEENPV